MKKRRSVRLVSDDEIRLVLEQMNAGNPARGAFGKHYMERFFHPRLVYERNPFIDLTRDYVETFVATYEACVAAGDSPEDAEAKAYAAARQD